MELRTWPPQIYTVAGLAGVAVPALAGGIPGASDAVPFQFPRPAFIEGLILLPLGNVLGVLEELAMLSVEIFDSRMRQITTDARGQEAGLSLPFALPGLLISGMGVRPFALQRPLSNNDVWTVTVRNRHTAPLTVAAIGFYNRQGFDLRELAARERAA